jgi:hypothetical protein
MYRPDPNSRLVYWSRREDSEPRRQNCFEVIPRFVQRISPTHGPTSGRTVPK